MLIVGFAGCSKQRNVTGVSNTKSSDGAGASNLKPVTGAFGYNLGDKVPGEIEDLIKVTDTPPFQFVSLDRISDGTICRIEGTGIVDESQDALHGNQKRLIAILTEKYGAREKIGLEKCAAQFNDVDLYFGIPNRAAHLGINYSETNQFISVEYYDTELQRIFYKEQESKDKTDDENKKNALKKGL